MQAILDVSELRTQRSAKARFPISDRLMGEFKAALQEHLGEIAQAQLVAQTPEHDEQDDIGRVLQEVKGSAGAFVKEPFTTG